MVVSPSITEEISELKRSRKAVILAHHYQESEIQELADSIDVLRSMRDRLLPRLLTGAIDVSVSPPITITKRRDVA
jgi:hypothetical protein